MTGRGCPQGGWLRPFPGGHSAVGLGVESLVRPSGNAPAWDTRTLWLKEVDRCGLRTRSRWWRARLGGHLSSCSSSYGFAAVVLLLLRPCACALSLSRAGRGRRGGKDGLRPDNAVHGVHAHAALGWVRATFPETRPSTRKVTLLSPSTGHLRPASVREHRGEESAERREGLPGETRCLFPSLLLLDLPKWDAWIN